MPDEDHYGFQLLEDREPALLVGIHLLIYVPDALAAIGREVRRAPLVRAASLRITIAMTVLAWLCRRGHGDFQA